MKVSSLPSCSPRSRGESGRSRPRSPRNSMAVARRRSGLLPARRARIMRRGQQRADFVQAEQAIRGVAADLDCDPQAIQRSPAQGVVGQATGRLLLKIGDTLLDERALPMAAQDVLIRKQCLEHGKNLLGRGSTTHRPDGGSAGLLSALIEPRMLGTDEVISELSAKPYPYRPPALHPRLPYHVAVSRTPRAARSALGGCNKSCWEFRPSRSLFTGSCEELPT